LSGAQLVEQRLALIRSGVSKPSVNKQNPRKKIASLIPLALVAPQLRHADRRAQLPRLCLLPTRNRERTLAVRLRFRCIRLRRHQNDFAGNAIDLGFAPPFPVASIAVIA
jgi:hypothetical protein